MTRETLDRAVAVLKAQNLNMITFVIATTPDNAPNVAAIFGVEWQPDENGDQRIGNYLIVTRRYCGE